MTQYVTGGSFISVLFLIVMVVICWHWVESGESFAVGAAMTWQDAKVATSCRSLNTGIRFLNRRYEDYLLDRPIFQAPGWKHFICPIYGTDAERSQSYRQAIVPTSCAAMPAKSRDKLDQWLSANGDLGPCETWELYP